MRQFSLSLAFSIVFVVGGCAPGTPAVVDMASCDADPRLCGGCLADTDCVPTSPRCDLTTNRCVECLPAMDNCGAGKRCAATGGSYQCTAMCAAKADCMKIGGPNFDCCGTTCIDTTIDPANCGGCGKPCAPQANANIECKASACDIASCKGTFADCDHSMANGCEVDKNSDGKNCGGCGAICSLTNAMSACMGGACAVVSCSAGFGDCDKDPKNGCELDVRADVANCGVCAMSCMPPANASPVCAASLCGLGVCNMGFKDCDNVAGNGCETNAQTDVNNCGSCAMVCVAPNSLPACMAGMCALASCSPNYADCDKKVADGCEVKTSTDVNNCGGCGQACAVVANGLPNCVNATCGILSCNAGFADCDKAVKTGCEVDLNTVANCGACGMACAVAHATPNCKAMVCGVAMCDALYGDCNMMAADGCEVSEAADIKNCGACAKVCVAANGTPNCANGVCGVAMCNAGFGDCNKLPADGCEVNTNTDAANCGACGKACANGQTCVAGVCTTCNPLVLVLGADNQGGTDNALVTALTKAGLTPTLVATGGTTYAGNPAAATYGAVVVITGNNYSTDMAAAGQTAIVNAVKGTTGVVFTEWGAYQVSTNHWVTLAPLLLLQRTSGNTSTLTFTNTVQHPVWTGLPASFVTLNSMGSNIGSTLLNGGTQIATCTECNSSGVVVRDNGGGRVVQIAYTAGYSAGFGAWANDANTTLLMTNAVKWAAHCL